MREITLGSLFDGSGGFPLAGVLNGIEPVWASEIEPFPIRVTKARFPNMKHLGSVTDINGADIEPVDIITFGSPCQDLSVAGKQAGIHEGQRSNLFFEAIRIIKEMREHDRTIGRTDDSLRPRFAVWENVPGAFSSNKGKDFQAVLQAFCSIRGGQDHIVPMPPKNKWLPFGTIVGDGWSVAWRVYDAQYWGVPQRRKRIYLIADFGSERAGEILSERESVRWDFAESGEAREGTAADAQGGAGRSDCVKCLNPWDCQSKRQYSVDGVYRTLDAGNCAGGQAHGVCYALDSMSSNSMKSSNPRSGFHEETITKTLDTNPDPTCNQGGNVIVQPAAVMARRYCDDGSTPTLKSAPSGGNTVPDVVYPINTMVATRGGKDDMRTCFGVGEPNDPQFTISAAHEHAVCFQCCGDRKDPSVSFSEKAYCLPANPMSDRGQAVCYGIDCRNAKLDEEKCHTIQAKANGGGFSLKCTPSVVYRQDGFAGYSEGVGTLKASGGDAGGVRKASSLSVFENHSQDSRYTGPMSVSQTVSATFGMGGNNQPFVVERISDE